MKRFSSMIAWILTLCVLTAALAGCGAGSADADRIAQLEQENAELRDQVAALTARLDELEGAAGFKTWKLSAEAWSDSNGACVTFTGEPRNYEDGMTATLIVRLDGEEVNTESCTWNGTAFEASVDLEAADGYSYTIAMTTADGSREQIVLNSPDNAVYDTLVYIQSSLNAYCNLFVSDWENADGKLTITSGYVQVQLPQITPAGTSVTFESAKLVLQLNGNPVETLDLELPEGEGAGSYETALTSTAFTMPEMAEDYQLDLILEVKLSGSADITANGGSWFFSGDQLVMVVG